MLFRKRSPQQEEQEEEEEQGGGEGNDPTPISREFLGCSRWTSLPMFGLRGAKTLS